MSSISLLQSTRVIVECNCDDVKKVLRQKTPQSAGFDINLKHFVSYSICGFEEQGKFRCESSFPVTSIDLKENQMIQIKLAIKTSIPENFYCQLAMRSSWSKHFSVLGGVIDCGFYENWEILLHTLQPCSLDFTKDLWIVQGIFLPCPRVTLMTVDSLDYGASEHTAFGKNVPDESDNDDEAAAVAVVKRKDDQYRLSMRIWESVSKRVGNLDVEFQKLIMKRTERLRENSGDENASAVASLDERHDEHLFDDTAQLYFRLKRYIPFVDDLDDDFPHEKYLLNQYLESVQADFIKIARKIANGDEQNDLRIMYAKIRAELFAFARNVCFVMFCVGVVFPDSDKWIEKIEYALETLVLKGCPPHLHWINVHEIVELLNACFVLTRFKEIRWKLSKEQTNEEFFLAFDNFRSKIFFLTSNIVFSSFDTELLSSMLDNFVWESDAHKYAVYEILAEQIEIGTPVNLPKILLVVFTVLRRWTTIDSAASQSLQELLVTRVKLGNEEPNWNAIDESIDTLLSNMHRERNNVKIAFSERSTKALQNLIFDLREFRMLYRALISAVGDEKLMLFISF